MLALVVFAYAWMLAASALPDGMWLKPIFYGIAALCMLVFIVALTTKCGVTI